MAVFSRIVGTGSYLPEKVLTNADLEKIVETSDEWIASRTGIRERHIAAEGETTGDLAYHASVRALEAAGVDASELDLRALHAGGFQRARGGVEGEVAGRLALGGDVALADAATRDDPLVGGLDHLLEVGVGQHLLGKVAARAHDARIDGHCHS